MSIKNIFIIFIVSGFWHGANWTFIMWGLTHALLYIPLFLIGKNRQYTTNVVAKNNWFPSIKELFQMGMTFFSTTIAWVFFRSESISDSFNYLILMVSKFSIPTYERFGIVFVFILVLVVFDWIMRKNERNPINIQNKYTRWIMYIVLIYLIISYFNIIDTTQFIYFQF